MKPLSGRMLTQMYIVIWCYKATMTWLNDNNNDIDNNDHGHDNDDDYDRKWQDYVYIQCEYKSTKQKIKHLLREENKVKENKIS